MHLTQRKAVGIAYAIIRLLRKTRDAMPKFQSVVGKMRHVATILPSARSLFTPINRALRGTPSTISLSASGEVRAALLDLRQMVTTLAARPTHVKEILPAPNPDYIGYCDASAFGAGGVWFSGQCPLPETVWQLHWLPDITAAIVSESNPTGTLNNSELEAVVVQLNVLETLVSSMHHKSTHIHSDNTPSVAWLTEMTTKTATSDAAHYPPGSGARQFLPSSLNSRACERHYGARHAVNDACQLCTTGDSCTTQPNSLGHPARSNTR